MRALWIVTVLGLLVLVAWLGSRWALRVAAALAVIAAAMAVARIPSEDAIQAEVCEDADRALSNGDVELARRSYLAVLGENDFVGGYFEASQLDGDECAVTGLKDILARELADEPACQGGNRLLAAGAGAEAEEFFVRLLRRPIPDAHECAQAGLDRARQPATGENTFDEVVVQGADNFAKRLTAALGTPAAPGPVTWGVLIVALGILYRGLEILNARRDPVPVAIAEVASLPGAGSDGGDTAADGSATIKTLLRDRLSRTGLVSPSTIPGVGGEASGLLEKNPFAEAGWIGKAVGFLITLAVPPRGVKVSATTLERSRDDDNCGLAVDVTDVRTGRALLVRTVWGKDIDETVDRTAYAVAQHAMDRCRTLPPWTYWGDPAGQSLFFFERGRDALADGNLEEASNQFGQAANSAPTNALARLELAEIREMSDDFLSAIAIYLDASRNYEQLLQARYRLAVALNFVKSWVTHWSSDAVARRLITRRLAGDRPLYIPAEGPEVVPFFLEIARQQILALQLDLRIHKLAWWCRRTAYRRLFWPLLVPFGRTRRLMCSKVETVGLAVRLRLDQANGRPLDEIRQEMKALKPYGWQAHYNLACCYAMFLRPPPPLKSEQQQWEQDNDHDAMLAVDALMAALSDPRDPFPVAVRRWLLEEDPDLAALRHHCRFSDWAANLSFSTKQDEQLTATELPALSSGWRTFATSARLAANEWALRAAAVAEPIETLHRWCVVEQRRWAIIGRWAGKPASKRRQVQLATTYDVQEVRNESSVATGTDEPSPEAGHLLREHIDLLNRLAPRLEEGWRQRAETLNVGTGNAGLPPWVQQTAALWQALQRVAQNPQKDENTEELGAAVAAAIAGFQPLDSGRSQPPRT